MSVPADLLDDLAVRFVLNMPEEEKNDPIRICFQIEVAFWFYTDFYCETMPHLPRLKLRKFAYIMFEYIPRLHKFLDPQVFDQVITNWIEYKFSIPCSGAVLLDKNLEYVLLVQGYGSKNWSFPKGKVNHDETLINCAIREVLEETGYDCSNNIYEHAAIDRNILESVCKLFIVTDVDMNYNFHPHVRNEIRSIQWFAVNDLPMRPVKKAGPGGAQPQTFSKFFTVYPFIPLLRKWIEKERRHRRKLARKDRQRTFTNGSNSEGPNGSGSGSGEDVASSNALSPYTVVEDDSLAVGDKSTSFVDVKLDDIYADDSIISTVGNSNASMLHEQSVVGVPVFNADSERENCTSLNDHQQHKTTYPKNWQALVNAFNRSNSTMHTHIGYDLMEDSRVDGPTAMSTPIKRHGPPPLFAPVPSNGVIRAEDLEAAPPLHPQPAAAATTTQDGIQLHNLLGSKALTCGDKLNFLFSMAATNQQTVLSASATPPPDPTQEPMAQLPQQKLQQQPQQPQQQQQQQQPQLDLMSFLSNGLSSMNSPATAAATSPNAYNGLSMLFSSSTTTMNTTTQLNVTQPSSRQSPNKHQQNATFKPLNKQQQQQPNVSSSSQSSKSSPFGAIGSTKQQLQQQFDRMLSGAAASSVTPTAAAYLQTSSRTGFLGPPAPLPPSSASANAASKAASSGYTPDAPTLISETSTTASFFAAASVNSNLTTTEATNSYGVYQLFGNRANLAASLTNSIQPPIEIQPGAYNGLNPKIVPEVQTKIRLLIDRLKFLNGD